MIKDNQRESDSDRAAKHLFGHGRLSYIQIPALDVAESAAFYEKVFGWKIGGGRDDHISFSDATGEMIGAWVTDLAISRDASVLPFIYVHDVDGILGRITANGGKVVKPIYPEGDLWVATFRAPAGNVIGIWPQRPR